MSMDAERDTKSRFAAQWHYRPDVPIPTSPVFSWPPHPRAIAVWFAARWFVFGENLVIAVLALVTWHYFQPPLERMVTFEIGWIAQMLLRNFILLVAVAGSLHFFLHVRKTQQQRLKFDPRDLISRGRLFSFNSQLKDNMFWTLTSGLAFWTAFEVLMLWAMANGYAPVLGWADNPVWFAGLLLLTPLWISFHFYWIHRLLHWPPLYKLAHALHHRNTNIGPWSGLSMHPVEHLLFFSSVLIHWIVAAHPIHILFHMQHQALTAVTSHAGFEALLVRDRQVIGLGNFHHQMHHRYFECNYGNLEVPWDKAFGSFHDGTEESHKLFLARRRKMMGLQNSS
ncbi:sterol desaturase family protein [Coralliovum pocilloporae]|uniref:sterol desaturase family protein n=1 Tax=Coralliovum pocilloporae TaxID=3066369 RepID=UPI0033070454